MSVENVEEMVSWQIVQMVHVTTWIVMEIVYQVQSWDVLDLVVELHRRMIVVFVLEGELAMLQTLILMSVIFAAMVKQAIRLISIRIAPAFQAQISIRTGTPKTFRTS